MSSTKAGIKIEGLNALARQLKELSAEAVVELKALNLAAAEDIAQAARDRTPVDTGMLQDSIKAHATARRGTVTVGGTGIPYAAVIHFGWPAHNISPAPFLYEALDTRREAVFATYDSAVNALVDRTIHTELV